MTPAQQKKEHIRIRKLIVGTFDTELGRKLLEHLENTLVDRDIYAQGMTLDQVAFRQGQADVIKQIKKELNNG